jgi:hypothetical protein
VGGWGGGGEHLIHPSYVVAISVCINRRQWKLGLQDGGQNNFFSVMVNMIRKFCEDLTRQFVDFYLFLLAL